jgi:hypothetical protein
MLREWEKEQPGPDRPDLPGDERRRAVAPVGPESPSFASLQATGTVNPEGDRAFDEEEFDACGPAAGAEPIRSEQPIRILSAASGAAPASPPHGDSSP